jgi:DNA-binding protein YbaB
MQNPFKMLGDMNAMRKQAMMIQQMLEKEEFTVISGNIKIVISGNQNVKLVEVDGVKNDALMRAFNDAIKRSQQAAAGKLGEISKQMGMGE